VVVWDRQIDPGTPGLILGLKWAFGLAGNRAF
jgi:hypothetical protein